MEVKRTLDYLKKHGLILATAESCTAGSIINRLAKIPNSGECIDLAFVVYSLSSKKRLLYVKQKTVDQYTVTSEEVAYEMCLGALNRSEANVAISTTGIAGKKPMDGIPAGTVCFSWGFKTKNGTKIYTKTRHFSGSRTQIVKQAALYALNKLPFFHEKANEKNKKRSLSLDGEYGLPT